MKKTTKSLLTTALILFCAGLLLALSAALYAKIAKVEIYDIPKKARTIESATVSLERILAASPESNYGKNLSPAPFRSVEINSFAGDIEVLVGGDKTQLALDKANTNNLNFQIQGDTLLIEEVDPVGFMGFYIDKGGLSFAGLRHIFRPGNAINSRKTVTLNLGSDVVLDKLEINSTSGDISVREISAAAIGIRSSKGKVQLKELKNPESKINIQGNATDVVLDKCQYVSCSVSTHFGKLDAHLIESTTQSTVLDLWSGSVKIKTDLPTSHYKLSLSTTVGEIRRNGENCGKKLTQDGGSAALRISSGILAGNFSLDFAGGDEKDFVPALPPAETPSTEETPQAGQEAAAV